MALRQLSTAYNERPDTIGSCKRVVHTVILECFQKLTQKMKRRLWNLEIFDELHDGDRMQKLAKMNWACSCWWMLPCMPYFTAGICDNKCQCGISEFFMMRNSKQLNVMWSSWNTHPEQPFWSTRQTEHYQHWSVAADDDPGSEAHSPFKNSPKLCRFAAS